MAHSSWTAELKLDANKLIFEFNESCRWQRQTQFGSIEISENQLYVYWQFVWRNMFRLLAKSKSCVDFVRSTQAEIACRFFQVIYWCSLEFDSDLRNLHRGGELYGERRLRR